MACPIMPVESENKSGAKKQTNHSAKWVVCFAVIFDAALSFFMAFRHYLALATAASAMSTSSLPMRAFHLS